MKTPRERWGTCCPWDPECEHSFLDSDDLVRWMNSPLSDAEAARIDGGPMNCPECGELLNDDYLAEHLWYWHGGPEPLDIDGEDHG